MAYGSARAFASAFRAIGLDAEPTPPSDHRTRELGARYTSGDECYPGQSHGGRFHEGAGAARDAIPRASPSSCPPPRAPAASASMRPTCATILDANGYGAWRFSRPPARTPTRAWATLAKPFVRTGWRALLCADLLQKLLLIRRPYEERRGDTEAVYEESLADLCAHARSNAGRARRAACGAARFAWCAAATASASCAPRRDRKRCR